ncbi:MAG: SDR family oxidoreductase [Chloroflexi bacterium]|nr:SDR family oxidoreductase [Chloroflexota bacterium]
MKLQAGDRALVTGASYGIGEAIARELASRGVDLLLLARSEDRLRELATELSGVRCEVLACDLHDRVPRTDELGRVDLLVNNAGFGATGRFESSDVEWAAGMIDVNVRALATLTRSIVPQLLDRGRGGILNVASTAAFQPLPYMAEYAATKAFVLSFSRALHVEYRSHGITVTALCPGATYTRFHRIAHASDPPPPFGQSPREVARYGLRGLESGKATAVSGWYNRLGAAFAEVTPGMLAATLAGVLMNAIRKR